MTEQRPRGFAGLPHREPNPEGWARYVETRDPKPQILEPAAVVREAVRRAETPPSKRPSTRGPRLNVRDSRRSARRDSAGSPLDVGAGEGAGRSDAADRRRSGRSTQEDS